MIKKIFSTLIVLALVAGGGYAFYKTLVEGGSDPPPPIVTKAVRTADIDETIVALGEVEPELFTDVKSEVSGRVAKVMFGSGEEVERGDVLLELDRSELESELKEAEFGIEDARLKAEKVKLNFESTQNLAKKDFVSQRELADAKIDHDLALNALDIQRAKVQTLREKLAKTVILAPHAGIILNNNILEGTVISGASSVSEGTLLMQVAQLSHLRVNTDVNEVDVANLAPNMEVDLTFDSLPDTVIPGKIVFVSPSAEPQESGSSNSGARVFPIIVTFATTNPRIRPGMTAKVNIVLSSVQNVLAAALPTLFLEEGKQVVYVRKADDTYDRRVVVTGISDHDVIEIKEGLAEGEELAMSKPVDPDAPVPGGAGRRSS